MGMGVKWPKCDSDLLWKSDTSCEDILNRILPKKKLKIFVPRVSITKGNPFPVKYRAHVSRDTEYTTDLEDPHLTDGMDLPCRVAMSYLQVTE